MDLTGAFHAASTRPLHGNLRFRFVVSVNVDRHVCPSGTLAPAAIIEGVADPRARTARIQHIRQGCSPIDQREVPERVGAIALALNDFDAIQDAPIALVQVVGMGNGNLERLRRLRTPIFPNCATCDLDPRRLFSERPYRRHSQGESGANRNRRRPQKVKIATRAHGAPEWDFHYLSPRFRLPSTTRELAVGRIVVSEFGIIVETA